MQGVADGAELPIDDIVALNVRTEINFGMFRDGCTALAWHTNNASFLAQNWDWKPAQAENLIAMTIAQTGKPTVKMITEAGIIGKIGFNSAGVGVCLNAIRAHGVDKERVPCHLALRMVLESNSVESAVQSLAHAGVASACHILVADKHSSVGLECSSVDIQRLQPNQSRQVFHTNHYLLEHKGVKDTNWLRDSTTRLTRIERLSESLGSMPDAASITGLFEDEDGAPSAICREARNEEDSETIFHITMELREREATVKVGKPLQPKEVLVLSF